ncbi:glutathione S-transferase N-terminal domain-containing protein [Temperatibacter marinus]|uniref:Glutathione S-transferase N-terminal domain-containing protein n=1 Tax=Temperatibacter marinus TaxID=1456591 RepID=A0AA52EK09_9PROT|nr:glutathione S-transferase N-terminal domain-containing protein [Temperatibacter marinus]WND03446.1 glutathione S-transferase N-terminal domain-containing protein [Temperatibacter marinus]
MSPVLYSFRRCPYAMRARLAIKSSGFSVEIREVVLRDKPQAMLSISPKATVPVLVVSPDLLLEESLDVMRYILGKHDPQSWLSSDTEKAKPLLEGLHAFFIPELNKYKYAKRDYDNIDPLIHREKALSYLRELDQKLANGRGLITKEKGFVDYVILPFVRQFSMVEQAWFNDQDLPNLRPWLKTFLEGDLFQSIMTKYSQWHEGDEPQFF